MQGVRTPPEMTCGFLIQLVFRKKKKPMWLIGVEVEQETSAPPPVFGSEIKTKEGALHIGIPPIAMAKTVH